MPFYQRPVYARPSFSGTLRSATPSNFATVLAAANGKNDCVELEPGEYGKFPIVNGLRGPSSGSKLIIHSRVKHGATFSDNSGGLVAKFMDCHNIHLSGVVLRASTSSVWVVAWGYTNGQTSPPQPCTHWRVQHCLIDGTNCSQAIYTINGASSFHEVWDNDFIGGAGEILYTGSKPEYNDRGHDFHLRGNDFRGSSRSSGTGGGEAIDIKPVCYNVTIEHNTIHDLVMSHSGAVVMAQNDINGNFYPNDRFPNGIIRYNRVWNITGSSSSGICLPSEGLVAYGNLIWNVQGMPGIGVQGWTNEHQPTGGPVFIWNNTIWNCNGSIVHSGYGGSDTRVDVRFNRIQSAPQAPSGGWASGSTVTSNAVVTASDFVGPVTGLADSGLGIGSGFRLSATAGSKTGTTTERFTDATDLFGVTRAASGSRAFGAFESGDPPPEDGGGTPPTPPPVAAFGFSPTSPSAGDTVSFTDQTTPAATSWAWNFGAHGGVTFSGSSGSYGWVPAAQVSGASGSTPTVTGSATSAANSNYQNSWAVSMPSGIVAGELLLVCTTSSASSPFTTPSGWTELQSATHSFNYPRNYQVFGKIAAGSEGSTQTFSFPSGQFAGFSAVAVRVANHAGLANVTVSTPGTGGASPLTVSAGTAGSNALSLRHIGGSGRSSWTPPAGVTLVAAGFTTTTHNCEDRVYTDDDNSVQSLSFTHSDVSISGNSTSRGALFGATIVIDGTTSSAGGWTELDLVAEIDPDDWTPAATDTLIGRNDNTATGDGPYAAGLAYELNLTTAGALQLRVSSSGSNGSSDTYAAATSTADLSAATSPRFVRGTYRLADGNTTFYTARFRQGPWTQLGDSALAPITGSSIHDSTARLTFGARFDTGSGQMFAGKIFYAAVGNQIDGPPVVVFDPSQATGTSSTWTASTGQTVTLASATNNGAATSTAQNPTYVYARPGSYPVTLTASNTNGASTASALVTVSATDDPDSPVVVGDVTYDGDAVLYDGDAVDYSGSGVSITAPTAGFEASTYAATVGQQVWFDATGQFIAGDASVPGVRSSEGIASEDPITSYAWVFTGAFTGTASGGYVSVIAGGAGTISATLTVTGAGGTDSTTKQVQVSAAPTPAPPSATNTDDIIVEVAPGSRWDAVSPTWVSVSSPTDRVQSIQIQRGLSSEDITSRFPAGTCSVTLDNGDGALDPTVGGLAVPPGTQLRVRIVHDSASYTLFRGWVPQRDGVRVIDEGTLYSRVELTAVDAVGLLARWQLPTLAAPAHIGDLPGRRVNRVLDHVGFPNAFRGNVKSGQAMLANTEWGTNALEHAQAVAFTEGGAVYADRSGLLRFDDRWSLHEDPRSTTSQWTLTASGDVAIKTMSREWAIVTSQVRIVDTSGRKWDAGAASVDDVGASDADEYPSLAVEWLQAQALADWMVATSGTQQILPLRVTVDPLRSTAATTFAARVDLRERLTATFTPVGGTERSHIAHVVGISHSILPRQWSTTVTLSEATRFTALSGSWFRFGASGVTFNGTKTFGA